MQGIISKGPSEGLLLGWYAHPLPGTSHCGQVTGAQGAAGSEASGLLLWPGRPKPHENHKAVVGKRDPLIGVLPCEHPCGGDGGRAGAAESLPERQATYRTSPPGCVRWTLPRTSPAQFRSPPLPPCAPPSASPKLATVRYPTCIRTWGSSLTPPTLCHFPARQQDKLGPPTSSLACPSCPALWPQHPTHDNHSVNTCKQMDKSGKGSGAGQTQPADCQCSHHLEF